MCLVGAVLALFISGRNEHADEPDATTADLDGDDSPTQMIDAPTHAFDGLPDQSTGKHRR